VCHGRYEVTFVITFIGPDDQDRWLRGPKLDIDAVLLPLCAPSACFAREGDLMPDTHTLSTLISYLEANVKGGPENHDVPAVQTEVQKWFPRPEEYAHFVHMDPHDPTKYTRNLIAGNEHWQLLLMCWPPGSKSAIHGHDDGSCWVRIVEGEVFEVLYAMPAVDAQFMKAEMENPSGAVGRCGPLRKLRETHISIRTGVLASYANDDIGVHRVENRSDKPAYTLHCYAPGLQKMKLFKECGSVCIHTVASAPIHSENGKVTGLWGKDYDADGVIDIALWNNQRCGKRKRSD
jgi:cysteine dioxygenase